MFVIHAGIEVGIDFEATLTRVGLPFPIGFSHQATRTTPLTSVSRTLKNQRDPFGFAQVFYFVSDECVRPVSQPTADYGLESYVPDFFEI